MKKVFMAIACASLVFAAHAVLLTLPSAHLATLPSVHLASLARAARRLSNQFCAQSVFKFEKLTKSIFGQLFCFCSEIIPKFAFYGNVQLFRR